MQRFLLFFVGIMVFLFPLVCFGQEGGLLQQGFTSYSQNADDSFSFSCGSECFASLGVMGKSESLTLNGKIQGNGIIGYGFLFGEQFVLGELIQVENGDLNKNFLFTSSQYFTQIPKDVQIILIVQGLVNTENIEMELGTLNFKKKFFQGRSDFLTDEPLTVYSINLRYGQKILGISVMKYVYRIAIIALMVLFLRKKSNLQNVFLTLGTVFLLLTMRQTREYGHIVIDEIKGMKNQNFPVVGDMYEFVKEAREQILDTREKGKEAVGTCKIYMQCQQDRPFCSHMGTLFFQPCERELSLTGDFQYLLFYKTAIPEEFNDKKVLVESKGSSLLAY